MSQNVIKLHQNKSTELYMLETLENLELVFKIPMTLFVARLRGVEMNLSSNVELHLNNIINQFGKDNWLIFLEEQGSINRPILIGSHIDYSVPHNKRGGKL